MSGQCYEILLQTINDIAYFSYHMNSHHTMVIVTVSVYGATQACLAYTLRSIKRLCTKTIMKVTLRA